MRNTFHCADQTIFVILILAGGAYFIHRKLNKIITEQAAAPDRAPVARSL